MSHEFKVGDRVRYTGDYTTSLIGREGIVTNAGTISIYVKGWCCPVLPENITVIHEPKTAEMLVKEYFDGKAARNEISKTLLTTVAQLETMGWLLTTTNSGLKFKKTETRTLP